MNWALKNFGLTALGFCLLAGAAAIEMRLESIEDKLTKVTTIETNLAGVSHDLRLAALPTK